MSELMNMMFIVSVLLVVAETHREVVAERPPLLLCQYGSGHGKGVFSFEVLDEGQILTDENEVFDLRICTDWRNDGKESE